MFDSISPEVTLPLKQNTCDFVSYTLLNGIKQNVQIHDKTTEYFMSFYTLQSFFENINIINSKI